MSPQEIVEEMLRKDSFSKWAEMKLIAVDAGTCELGLNISATMLNGFEILHGGVVFSLADSALAFAANAKGRKAKTLDAHCSYLSPSFENSYLIAKAVEIKSGKNIGFFRVEVFNGDKLVFVGSFTVSFSQEIWSRNN